MKNSEGEADVKAMRNPAAKHHNPKMDTDEPAKLAMGGLPPQAMPPAPPIVRNTMTPKRPRHAIAPRLPASAAPIGVPVMKKGGRAEGGSAGEHESDEGDHAGADEAFPKKHHKHGGAIKEHLKKHMKKGHEAHPDEDADDYKHGGKAYKIGGKVHGKDPALHNAKTTDAPKHGDSGHIGDLEHDGGFKRGGHTGTKHSDHRKMATGGHIQVNKADRHPGKSIGDNGPVVKKYKAGGAVKGHHEEDGHKHMHESGMHHKHGHEHMHHEEKHMHKKH